MKDLGFLLAIFISLNLYSADQKPDDSQDNLDNFIEYINNLNQTMKDALARSKEPKIFEIETPIEPLWNYPSDDHCPSSKFAPNPDFTWRPHFDGNGPLPPTSGQLDMKKIVEIYDEFVEHK